MRSTLRRIDGRGYKAYRDLIGKKERVKNYEMEFLRVQGDPFASPSVISVRVPFKKPEFSKSEVGVEDFLYRRLHYGLKRESYRAGEGKSGYLGVPEPRSIMLRRSAVHLEEDLRFLFFVGLPARHRRILGIEAERIIYEKIPRALDFVLRYDEDEMRRHVETYDLQEELRKKLRDLDLIAFVGDGSILPRKCGDCDAPLPGAVPFRSPDSLRISIETSLGEIVGMGIRRGITAISGTAFHGKSTLLNAIRDGIYNHIPGDGRERVVSVKNSFKIRAEDGRSVRCVDISSFIYNLPSKKDTKCFSTDNASGATSMAATVQESVEIGANLLLVDEDTSATNLLFYDERTSHLFRHKTVKTLIENARDMADRGISLIIVSSGTLPLLESADTVIVMEDYAPRVVKIHGEMKFGEYREPEKRILARMPKIEKMKLQGSWLTSKSLSRPIRMENDEQVQENAQANFIAHLLLNSKIEGKTMREIAKGIDDDSHLIYRTKSPALAEVRGMDVVFALNRIPEIEIRR